MLKCLKNAGGSTPSYSNKTGFGTSPNKPLTNSLWVCVFGGNWEGGGTMVTFPKNDANTEILIAKKALTKNFFKNYSKATF